VADRNSNTAILRGKKIWHSNLPCSNVLEQDGCAVSDLDTTLDETAVPIKIPDIFKQGEQNMFCAGCLLTVPQRHHKSF
jgi:hypothetical protein